jgi:hypothetical protein
MGAARHHEPGDGVTPELVAIVLAVVVLAAIVAIVVTIGA